MRRKIIAAAVVLALLGALCAGEYALVRAVCGDALAGTQAIIDAIRAGELGEAMAHATRLDEDWDKRGTLLELVVDHKAVDDVRFALSRLIAAAESGDRESAMIYACELEGGVEHVIERQTLSLANVL